MDANSENNIKYQIDLKSRLLQFAIKALDWWTKKSEELKYD